MEPILQVRVDELPVVPDALRGVALLTLFLNRFRLPVDLPSVNGDGWLIRSYDRLGGLTERKPTAEMTQTNPFK